MTSYWLRILRLGWGPGKILVHFLVVEAVCTGAIRSWAVPADLKWIGRIGARGHKGPSQMTVLRATAIYQRLRESNARKSVVPAKDARKEGMRVTISPPNAKTGDGVSLPTISLCTANTQAAL